MITKNNNQEDKIISKMLFRSDRSNVINIVEGRLEKGLIIINTGISSLIFDREQEEDINHVVKTIKPCRDYYF